MRQDRIEYTLKGEMTKGTGGTDIGSAALYWSNVAPTGKPADETNKLSATASTITLSGDNKVYVYMVADNTDAMKAGISLTFEAKAATT